MLITVLPTNTRTALCYLTPAPRTKQRGRSSPGPSSLGISIEYQPLVLRLVQNPPVGPRTYYSFSASAEAGLVPHPHRLRLNYPPGRLSHPFNAPEMHPLRQPRLAGYSNRGDGTTVKSPFCHPLPTVQGLPCPALFHLNRVTIASGSVHRPNCSLQGLGKSGLDAVSYNPPGLGTPLGQESTKAWHVSGRGSHTD